MPKRFLLISYYWPPAGGVAVQRWLQFTKHLPNLGWQPVVFTAADADYPNEDPSLIAQVNPTIEVIRQPILEPYGLYRKLSRRGKDEQMYNAFNEQDKTPGAAQRLAIFLRSNLFIPDARMLWLGPSTRYLKKWLVENEVDAIVTNGPPHTVHLIGLRLKKQFPDLKWVADFRDPWTTIDYFHELKLLPRARRRHHRLEREVMSSADRVVTVSPSWAEDFRRIGGHDRVSVVTNGFDEAQFSGPPPPPDEKFTILHSGIVGKDRNYPELWRALAQLLAEDPTFANLLSIRLIGELDAAVFASLERHGLRKYVDHQPFLPHAEVVEATRRARLLLLLINRLDDNAPGRLPSKLYEYLGAGRPLLCLSPLRGDAASIIAATRAGETFLPNQDADLLDFLRRQFRATAAASGPATDVSAYGRRVLAGRYAGILEEVTAAAPDPAGNTSP